MRRQVMRVVCAATLLPALMLLSGCGADTASKVGSAFDRLSSDAEPGVSRESSAPAADSDPEADHGAVDVTAYGPDTRWRLIVSSATVQGDTLVIRVKADPTNAERRAMKAAAEAARAELGLPIERVSFLYHDSGYMAGYLPLE